MKHIVFLGLLLIGVGAIHAQDIRQDRLEKPPVVEEFIGHRFVEETGGGWGWIKKPEEDWKRAVWATLKERPPLFKAPDRSLAKRDLDQNHEYRLTGYFTNYEAYDPSTNEMLPVFVFEKYESLGAKLPLGIEPGPPSRFQNAKKNRSLFAPRLRFGEDIF